MQEIADAFHASHPNITINIQLTPNADYWTKLQTAAASGTAPDVFWMSTTRIGLYAGQKQLLSLSDKPGFDNSPFPKSLNDVYTLDGKQYGMPKDFDTVGLWYNKKLFDAAGVKYPTAGWTWQDVISAAQKLNDPGKGVWGIASPDWTQENLYNTMLQAGGQAITPDHKKSGFDDPKSIAGLQYALDFVTRYHVSPTAQQMTDTQPDQLFASGKVAMFADGDYDMPEYKAAARPGRRRRAAAGRPGRQEGDGHQRPGERHLRQDQASRGGLGVRAVPRQQGRQRDPGQDRHRDPGLQRPVRDLGGLDPAVPPAVLHRPAGRRRAVPGVEEHRGLDHADADHAGPDLGRQARSADRCQADRGPDERRTGQGVAGVSHRIPVPRRRKGGGGGRPGARAARRPVAARRPMVLMMLGKANPALAGSKTIAYLFYEDAFVTGNQGLAAAIAVVLTLVLLVLTALQFRLQKRWVHYG